MRLADTSSFDASINVLPWALVTTFEPISTKVNKQRGIINEIGS